MNERYNPLLSVLMLGSPDNRASHESGCYGDLEFVAGRSTTTRVSTRPDKKYRFSVIVTEFEWTESTCSCRTTQYAPESRSFGVIVTISISVPATATTMDVTAALITRSAGST
jgi:hypothetical protein